MYELTITNDGWAGDFELDETGDLVISTDTPTVPQATIERVARMIMTTPNITDANGNAVGFADDIFHTTFGAGMRAYVDGNFNQQTFNALIAAIKDQLADPDMGIAQNPAPTVTITQISSSSANLNVAFYDAVYGAYAVLPTLPLTALGS